MSVRAAATVLRTRPKTTRTGALPFEGTPLAGAVAVRLPATVTFVWSHPGGDDHTSDSAIDADEFLAERQRHAPISWQSLGVLLASSIVVAGIMPPW